MRAAAILLLAISLPLVAGEGAPAAAPTIKFPDFPLPKFALDEYGQTQRMSMLKLLRLLQQGGVHGMDNFEAANSDYLAVSSDSLGLMSAWLESACRSAGIQLEMARLRSYDGAVYANLLEVATSIAASRKVASDASVAVGVLYCTRDKPWGLLSGNGERDAYIIFATEIGFMVYDPPTRQLVSLAEFPNNESVLKVRI